MIAGRYTLVDEVGRGGMGVVWRGVDQVLDREVALKRVGMSPGGLSPDLARAEREARLAASLNHPNVVAVFDLVTEGDEQWLVMEYVENRTLAQLVRERGPLTPDEAARVLEQAAAALAAAHQAGIVHRDVKPSNILVTPDGRVKLSDFGIARAHTDATLTQTGLMSGSPAYLSPEVASGSSATAASDVWALGATLFHALTGRPPYEVGSNVMGALYQIVHEEPPRPENAGWLLPLLEHTMTKNPQQRWPMARVRDFLAGDGRTAVAPPVAWHDTEQTAVLAAAAPAMAPPRAAPPLAETPPPPPQPPPAEREPSGRSRGWLMPLLLVGALALLVGLGFWTLSPGDGERPDTTAGDTAATGSPNRSDGASPSESEGAAPSGSESATPTESPSERESPEATAEGMAAFVGDYLSTVTSDPRTTWEWLTPEFQQASGNYGSYRGFWSTIESAELQDVQADPETMTVSYSVTYTTTDGEVTTDNVTLGLVMQGDRYYIADEA